MCSTSGTRKLETYTCRSSMALTGGHALRWLTPLRSPQEHFNVSLLTYALRVIGAKTWRLYVPKAKQECKPLVSEKV